MAENSYGDVTLAFLLGAVVGAGVALLYAPATGADTRRRLADAADKMRAQSEDGYGRARDYVTEKYEQGRTYVEDAYDKGKSYVDDRKAEATAAVGAAKDAYKKAKEQH